MPVPYPIALENVEPRYPWSWSRILLSSSPGSAVQRTQSFWTLLCGEDNSTQTCTAVMDRRHRFWINDVRDGVCIWWSHQENPMDNGLTNQSPPPTPSITIDSTFGVPMVWCQARWRLQLLRRWLLCKSCILGHFYVSENCGFTVLWFYIYLDSRSSIWKFYILLKCINIHDEYLT